MFHRSLLGIDILLERAGPASAPRGGRPAQCPQRAAGSGQSRPPERSHRSVQAIAVGSL
jgi:hypothetical protein